MFHLYILSRTGRRCAVARVRRRAVSTTTTHQEQRHRRAEWDGRRCFLLHASSLHSGRGGGGTGECAVAPPRLLHILHFTASNVNYYTSHHREQVARASVASALLLLLSACFISTYYPGRDGGARGERGECAVVASFCMVHHYFYSGGAAVARASAPSRRLDYYIFFISLRVKGVKGSAAFYHDYLLRLPKEVLYWVRSGM